MKRTISFLLLVSLFVALPVRADVSVAVGSEHFFWEEMDPVGGGRLLDETGWRHFVAVTGSMPLRNGWRIGGMGKVYGGDVNYDGQLNNGTPYSTTTEYRGVNGELLFSRSAQEVADSHTDFELGMGLDDWSRDLVGPYGYVEDYQVFYGRIGINHQRKTGWRVRAGLLLPFQVKEHVNLYDGFALEPQGRLSLYAACGYQFATNWELSLDFSTYRFDQSDPVRVYSHGVYVGSYLQPESHQTTTSLVLGYRF